MAIRTALVTGGGSGIGRASAAALAADGLAVLVADQDAGGGEETVRQVDGRQEEAEDDEANGDEQGCEGDEPAAGFVAIGMRGALCERLGHVSVTSRL